MNDVWTSILNAWGKQTDQFGEPMYCKGRGPAAAKGLIMGT
jgi:hypothetical protein